MAADTMARAIKRADGLNLTARCASRRDVAVACAIVVPDVAVLDLNVYENDARVAVTSVRAQAPLARILLLIAQLDAEQLARALVAGAGNCISACVDRHTFVRSIRATAERRSIVPRELQERVVQLILELGDAPHRRLSAREIEVLRLAAKGLTIGDIAGELFISANTAKTHLCRAYHKLGVKNRGGAVAMAMRSGMLR